MNPDAALTRKLKALSRRIDRIQALITFLKKYPVVATRSTLIQLGNTVGLCLEEEALIKPVGSEVVALRLERYAEDFEENPCEERIVCADVSTLSSDELAQVLNQVRINLSRAETGEDIAEV
jgi:hypothetical protein